VGSAHPLGGGNSNSHFRRKSGKHYGKGHTVEVNSLAEALAALPAGLDVTEIVNMLKYPTCVGEARTVVLNLLEKRTGLQFHDDVWEVVSQSKALGLKLEDFTSPPERQAK
jgi:hypothetical protein